MLGKVPSIALGVIGLYAVHAWVLQVDGETSLGRRTALFALVVGGAAAIAWGASRLSPRMRALGMLLIGVAGLSIIGPIVGSHIAKLGLEGSAITGMIALAGAMVLTILGTVRLLRAARTLGRKLLALPIAFALLQFVVLS